ncbi:MAG: threonine/serine dehydratase [Hyphomicrobiales bacterium]|nr:threonine/serine dehydratase [Hyphomicrobiales bacterium]
MYDLTRLQAARERIRAHVTRTPLFRSSTLSDEMGCNVFIKAELFQKVGSFKARGMLNRLLTMQQDELRKGVITFSAGNAAQGLAYAARIIGTRAVIAMPEAASPAKIAATKGYGGEVILHGKNAAETYARCMEEVAARGLIYVPSYDDVTLMEGHASLGLEILEDVPELAAVFCGIGGGGLVGGIAMALRASKSKARIFGVEPELARCATEALRAGKPVQVVNGRTLADGLAPPIVGKACLPIIREEVEEVILVTEDEIANAIRFLLSRCKLLAEGAGAAPLAGFRRRKNLGFARSDNVVLAVCGGNIDLERLAGVLPVPPLS